MRIKWDEMQWCRLNSWYSHAETLTDGSYRIWVNSRRPEGGILPFSDFNKLTKWAGLTP